MKRNAEHPIQSKSAETRWKNWWFGGNWSAIRSDELKEALRSQNSMGRTTHVKKIKIRKKNGRRRHPELYRFNKVVNGSVLHLSGSLAVDESGQPKTLKRFVTLTSAPFLVYRQRRTNRTRPGTKLTLSGGRQSLGSVAHASLDR